MASQESSASEPQVPLFGGVLLTGLFLASTFGMLAAVAAARGALLNVTFETAMDSLQHNLVSLTLVQLCSMGSVLFVGMRMFGPDAGLKEALHTNPVRSKVLALCFGAGLCLQFPLAELSNLVHELVGPPSLEQQLAIKNLIDARSMSQGFLVVICLVAIVPACEELLFRGFFLAGFARRHGPTIALLASSTLFGASHGLVNALYAFGGGLILGRVFLWTRSVFPGMALHAAVNAVPVLLSERIVAIRGFNVPSHVATHIPLWLVLPSLGVAVVLLAWVRRIEYLHER